MKNNLKEVNKIWKQLTTSVDSRGYAISLHDPKTTKKSNTVFVEESDAFAIQFFKKDAKDYDKNIQIKLVSNTLDETTVNTYKNTPGLISSVLINDDIGIRSTPYVYLGSNYTELDVAASYFNVLGLLKSGLINQARQIASNITYMIGHTYSLKATNRIYHQHVRALPLYTAMIRAISDALPVEERSKFLKIHIARSILEYYRSWHSLNNQVIDGLNIYPKTNVDASTLSFSIPEENIIPVRLNMMLYNTEKDIAFFIANYVEGGKLTIEDKAYDSAYWNQKAETRLKKMNDTLWNTETSTFNDYNVIQKKHINLEKADFIYALWSGAATEKQGDILKNLIDKHNANYGFQYDLNSTSAQAPEQIIAWLGLLRYGFKSKSNNLKTVWQNMLQNIYNKNNVMALQYNIQTGTLAATSNGNLHSWTLASLIL